MSKIGYDDYKTYMRQIVMEKEAFLFYVTLSRFDLINLVGHMEVHHEWGNGLSVMWQVDIEVP